MELSKYISSGNVIYYRWTGKCWFIHNLVRYEFDLQFEIPATYPAAPIELELPELDGKTHKMYRGGKICLDIHFAPLWAKNQPKFGIAHALAAGVSLYKFLYCVVGTLVSSRDSCIGGLGSSYFY